MNSFLFSVLFIFMNYYYNDRNNPVLFSGRNKDGIS